MDSVGQVMVPCYEKTTAAAMRRGLLLTTINNNNNNKNIIIIILKKLAKLFNDRYPSCAREAKNAKHHARWPTKRRGGRLRAMSGSGRNNEPIKVFRITLMGRAEAGKTTLCSQFIANGYTARYEHTEDPHMYYREMKPRDLTLNGNEHQSNPTNTGNSKHKHHHHGGKKSKKNEKSCDKIWGTTRRCSR